MRRDRVQLDVDAHRNHRGPYTAAGDLVRLLTARAYAQTPSLVLPRALTLLCVAPEVRSAFPVPDAVSEALTFSREGDPAVWTRRLAHGIADFLLEYVAACGSRVCLSFAHVDRADWSDREFIAVLLRRADPDRVRVRVQTASERVGQPLLTALKDYARLQDELPPVPSDHRSDPVSSATATALARAYVESDCTSDSVLERQAYLDLPDAARAALHHVRASFLEGLHQPSLSLGAIPFHVEQAGGDAAVLAAASAACMRMAYYHAALDWAVRGRRMLAPANGGRTYAELTRHELFALMLLGRSDEAEGLCNECLAASADPALLVHVAYARAIMNARWYEPARRDYQAGAVWVERAKAFARQTPASSIRVVNLAFLQNTQALIEMREGRHHAAIQLLTEALASLAEEVPERYDKESPLFLDNRARVHRRLDQFEAALADWTTLLQIDPSNAEAYLSRGVLHHEQGRYESALRDYDAAIAWSPPWVDLHFNRAQILNVLGRHDEALVEYDRALTLVPDFVPALGNRACLHFHRRSFAAARADVERALGLSPDEPRLLCLAGLLQLRAGELDAADASFTRAIERDRSLADAWANRATVRFRRGAFEAALLDLTGALGLREDATMLSNRGRVFEALERWQEAADDYARALTVSGGDVSKIAARLASCRRRAGDPAGCDGVTSSAARGDLPVPASARLDGDARH